MATDAPSPALTAAQHDDADLLASLKLWVVLARAQKAIGAHARRDVEAQGVGMSEFAVLELLYHRGPLTTGQVGERVLLTSGSTTYVVDKLVARALVARRTCAEDHRVTYLELTADGRALIDAILPGHAEAIRAAMRTLSTEEKRACAALLKRLGRGAAESE